MGIVPYWCMDNQIYKHVIPVIHMIGHEYCHKYVIDL